MKKDINLAYSHQNAFLTQKTSDFGDLRSVDAKFCRQDFFRNIF